MKRYKENFWQVTTLVFAVLLVLSLVVNAIFILKNNVDLNKVPGFDRLYGLFLVLAVTFTVALGIIKTRIWLFFGSSMLTLLIIAIALFALFQVGARKLSGPKSKLKDKD